MAEAGGIPAQEDTKNSEPKPLPAPVDGEPNAAPEETTPQPEKEELQAFSVYVQTPNDALIQLQVSRIDTVQDIKQYLFEAKEICFITSYHLVLDGVKLNEYIELAELPNLKPNSTFHMQEAPYDERSARLHVRRLRDLLAESFIDLPGSPSVFSKVAAGFDDASLLTDVEKPLEAKPIKGKTGKKRKNKKGKANKEEPAGAAEPELDDEDLNFTQCLDLDLSKLFPRDPAGNQLPQCVRSICMSGWNPPPRHRRLLGDILYLDVTTVEGTSVSVTCHCSGFFVNNTANSRFDPAPSKTPHNSHHLVGLLQLISPAFRKNFTRLLDCHFGKHPFEFLSVPFAVIPWANKVAPHTFNLNRAEDALLGSSETDVIHGQLRDWNEEYQSCKDLPRGTVQERIVRDRALCKVNCDFVNDAMKGAIAIISGSVPVINPLDPKSAHMYIYNNIFFNYALDGRDVYKDYGGDITAYQAASNDLRGIVMANELDLNGIHTILTTLVDYRGYRLVAQCIVPGILHHEQTTKILYGSLDNGKTIEAREDFHTILAGLASPLHMKEHVCVDGEGQEHKLYCCCDSKGIIGTDGRKYLLDLLRTTPRDANFPEKESLMRVLRPELVNIYVEYRKEKFLAEHRKKKEGGKLEGDKKDDEKNLDAVEGAIKSQEEEEKFDIPEVLFNLDAFSAVQLHKDTAEEDTRQVKEASSFLLDVIIPNFVEDIKMGFLAPVDGDTLTTCMHTRGINMRYLGILTNLTAHMPFVQELCMREMIARAAKHIFNDYLRKVETQVLSPVVAHFLNCLLGNSQNKSFRALDEATSNKRKKPTKKAGDSFDGKNYGVTAASLWKLLHQEVLNRFRYDWTQRGNVNVRLMSTLRSFCQKVGIQLVAQTYDFTSPFPFSEAHVLDLYPIVKHSHPGSLDGRDLKEAGKSFMVQGRFDIAFELLSEALAIFHQVYGPMHKHTAQCYSNLAMVLFHAGDNAQAVLHQKKAVIIHERVQGLDHHDTAQAYSYLGWFCHMLGNHKAGVKYIKRSLYLSQLVCGTDHPENAGTWTNLAMIFQEMKLFPLAAKYLEEALRSYENTHGHESLQVAAASHLVAIAYSHLDDYKTALAFEKRNYNILHKLAGEGDVRTVESNIWLKQFTAKAVQVEREHVKEASNAQQIGGARSDAGRSAKVLNTGHIAPPTIGGLSSNVSLSKLPIGDIVNYIQGKRTLKDLVSANPEALSETPPTSTSLPKNPPVPSSRFQVRRNRIPSAAPGKGLSGKM